MDSGRQVKVLVADDEQNLRTILDRFLRGKGHSVVTAADGTSALEQLRRQSFDVALVDIKMPGMDGLDVLRQMRDQPEAPEVIIMTGDGTMDTAMAAVKLGAYDYILKPYRMDEVEILVNNAYEKRALRAENARLKSQLEHIRVDDEVLTRYPPLREALADCGRFARSAEPLLITGERGTGKALLSRVIHREGGSERLLVIATPHGASVYDVESALFGHEPGSHPGVETRRSGCFEKAAGGTLVIEDVHLLPAELHSKLEQAVRQRSFTRCGGTEVVRHSARVIATTSRDLRMAASQGTFSPALYDALAAETITLPPLRERAGDVLLLANHFLEVFSDSKDRTFASDAIAALSQYSWPGNIVELRNVVERVCMLSASGVIEKKDLPLPGIVPRSTPGASMPLAELERMHIQNVLAETNWHQGNAAAALGISSKTLYRKIREYSFVRPKDSAREE